MMAATKAVHDAQMTLSGAAKQFGVTRETSRRHVTGEVSMNARIGPPTVLMKEKEDEIVETCQVFAEWGFDLQKEDIKSVVAQFCQHSNRHNPFKNGIPGDDWWASFLRRHPLLVKRINASITTTCQSSVFEG